MKITETRFDGLCLLEPTIFADDRGSFYESYSKKELHRLGLHTEFVQDNHSTSKKNTLRGMHFQKWPQGQAKLIRCTQGSILDVVVDIRPTSPTYLSHYKITLSKENAYQLYIPNGFAHGFLVTSDVAEVQYKCSWYYEPDLESGFPWNDKAFNIPWPISNPILSDRDKNNPCYNNLYV